MKKIILILVIFFAMNSCSVSDDDVGQNYHFEILAVVSYTLPQTFTLGQAYPITVTYKRPSDCYFFDGFYYHKELNTRTIAIQTGVIEGTDCNVLDEEPIEVSFNFYATSNGSYIFKFYKGKDTDGTDIFDEVEIPVID